jgi:hypothetical protein
MIKFHSTDSKLILSYTPDRAGNERWAIDRIESDKNVVLKQTFTFRPEDVFTISGEDESFEHDLFNEDEGTIEFVLGTIVEYTLDEEKCNYYQIKKGVLVEDFRIFISTELEFNVKYFVADNNISVFDTIFKFLSEDLYIGGLHPNSLPLKDFLLLIRNFPNTWEKKLYARSRVTSILRQYFEKVEDATEKYERYLDKKISRKGADLQKLFKDQELHKYQIVLDKMKQMLASERGYSENQWQNEILQIILLLFPKYIFSFTEGPIRTDVNRRVDFLLVDAGGNIDILEIKKPHDIPILSNREYRNNYIPQKELSGTIMQVEKYIYHLNRWAYKGEKELTEKYKKELPVGFSLKITNPAGMIIMGRDNDLNAEQKLDFEVVRRKYINLIDILTYDDLIRRLEFTINSLRNT